jgi:hypothetical protein
MFTSHSRRIAAALTALLAATAAALAAPNDKPVAGQQVRFPNGYWSGLPQAGPDGEVRQCVLVALRRQQRSGRYPLFHQHQSRHRPCDHDPG